MATAGMVWAVCVKWFVERVFVAAEMVVVADGTGFHRHHIAGLQAGARAVFALCYFHVDGRIDHSTT